MQIYGLTISDGKVLFASRHPDGLHLNAAGLDPRGTDAFGTSTQDVVGEVELLVVVPTPVTVPTGEATLQFTAIGFDIFGNIVDVTPTWSIVEVGTDSTINSSTGVLTTGLTGEEEDITVRATVGDLTADAEVSVQDIVLDSIEVSPPSWSLTVGQTKTFAATGYVGDDPVGINPVWSKVSGVGSIDASTGLYTAGTTSGSAVIRATFGAVTEDVFVTVSPAALYAIIITGDTPSVNGERFQMFTLTGEDPYGNDVPLEAGAALWTLDPAAGSISGPNNQLTVTVYTVLNSTEDGVSYSGALVVTYGEFSENYDIYTAPNGGEPE